MRADQGGGRQIEGKFLPARINMSEYAVQAEEQGGKEAVGGGRKIRGKMWDVDLYFFLHRVQ